MIDWLNAILFRLWGDPVSWAELLGFLTGGACVWLTVRRHVLNFPVGLANSAMFLVLFCSARLWADAGLQVMFLALGVTGWVQWVRSGSDLTEVAVRRSSTRELAMIVALVVVATGGLTVLLDAVDDSAPFWDALTTSLSVAAQWLLNNRKVQTWWFWIAADCIYVPLYLSRDLNLTAVIYVAFLALCIGGLRSWRAGLAEAEPARDVAVVR